MTTEIDGTVYSGDFEAIHGRKPGEPAPEPTTAPQPGPVTVYSGDFEAIHGVKPGGAAPQGVPSVAAPRQDDGVRAKVITTDAAPAPVKSAPAETA